jgi:hypothetical protein
VTFFCPQCGAQAERDAKFCKACGVSVGDRAPEEPTQVSWPSQPHSTTAVIPQPPATQSAVNGNYGPPSAAATGRPGWLIPAIAAVALVVIAAVVAVVLVARGGSSGASFAEQATSLLSPVAAADAHLDTTLQSAADEKQLPAIGRAAAAAREKVVSAEGGLAVLNPHGKDAAAKRALARALYANLSYLDKMTAASGNLTAVRAAAAQTAAEQTASAFAAVGNPKVVVPAASAFSSAGQLHELATAEQTSSAKKSQATAAIREYVQAIDSLLQNSADTRSNLGTMISDIQQSQLSAAQATSQIASIINQRQDLQNQASAVAAPAAFRAASAKLRSSITAALADDYAIQSWINAWYDNDSYAFNNAYTRHLDATAKATEAKASFLATYNRLRSRYLHLKPINLNY